MRLPQPRGPMGTELFASLRHDDRRSLSSAHLSSFPAPPTSRAEAEAVVADEDLQLTLWTMYELHYRGFDDVDEDLEWAPHVLVRRRSIESVWERALRLLTADAVESVLGDEVGRDRTRPDDSHRAERAIAAVVDRDSGPSLAGFVQRRADATQVRELLVHRSLYHLKESDPQSWVLPRLDAAAKVALAELQYDEYGSGRVDRLHSTLFARALTAAGLDARYGAYLDDVPGWTLAVSNAMSMFALHRRLRGAAMGHLAAFEATSSVPCRRYLGGIKRLELPDAVAEYFDEHVEADAVHEHLASTGICGAMISVEPRLLADVVFGAAACVALDAIVAVRTLQAWGEGRTSLRRQDRAA